MRSVDLLINQLQDNRPYFRQRAAEELSEFNSSAAVEPLVTAFRDAVEPIRAAALKNLQRIAHLDLLPVLDALKDSSPSMRRKASCVIDQLSPKLAAEQWPMVVQILVLCLEEQRMVRPLIQSLQDQSPNVQINAMYALANLEQGAEEILKLIKEHPRPSVRRHAFTALGRMDHLSDSVGQELRILVQHDANLCGHQVFKPDLT